MKYLGINMTNDRKELHIEFYETLLNKWQDTP